MQVCVIEGDGIGHEVVPAAARVLWLVAPDIEQKPAEAGWDTFQRVGTSLPDATLDLAIHCGAVLFGAAASPSYPVEGYSIPVVRLRRTLQTYASLRPAGYLHVPAARPGVDLLVVRETTEDVYVGREYTRDEGRTGISEKVITRAGSERVAKRAYALALETGRHRVTIVHKASVMVQSDGLFRKVAFEIAEHYPEIQTDELLVDTAAYWMVKDPTRFDVLLTPNLYGDILSDMAAAYSGGLGLAPSLSLGAGVALAEPVHGCAPDIAGKGIANPTATILATALLLRHHFQRPDAADRIERAVRTVFMAGGYTADIKSDGALTTQQFTDRVCDIIAAE
ncbi:MAG: isocitrate/isopropylmalate dehydrogenase family protein [Chloroflexota bacterium]|nr:isocitrate/isopropylmalate dehydrogenase family protein [Chloroflexota bacterium]